MKRTLRILALVVVLAATVAWLAAGQNRGWTKTSKAIQHVDSVTQLEYSTQEEGFYPGVDFLALALVLGAGFLGASLFIRTKNTNPSSTKS